jgi:hypothetical protein
MALAPGLRSSVRIVVADTDTAVAMGSGDVPVLGTPRLLALAESQRCTGNASFATNYSAARSRPPYPPSPAVPGVTPRGRCVHPGGQSESSAPPELRRGGMPPGRLALTRW